MGEQDAKREKKQMCAGLLAHVDAGKTTLAEALLYQSGRIRRLGRVDHKDTFLDTYALERDRGITIFSKQARITAGEKEITLLDTPGHADFSAEMERTLQVLDYAILVISGADGVQGQVELLWRLLARYQIPVFLFVNKMDQEGTQRAGLLAELKSRLSENCIDFAALFPGGQPVGSDAPEGENASGASKRKDHVSAHEAEEFWESLALSDEIVMEQYLENGVIEETQIQRLIQERKVFPCFFGSALKLWGVDAFLEGFTRLTVCKAYPQSFGARVFKISRDEQGNRLTHMKITGGSLAVKALICKESQEANGSASRKEMPDGSEETVWQEKADQLRIYSGSSYELQQEVSAGSICAVTGLTHTFAGEGLGFEQSVNLPLLCPVLNYRLLLPEGVSAFTFLARLRQLEEEEPLLHVVWEETAGEIHLQLMGEVQIEVLKVMIEERFGVAVQFDNGSIVYKETLTEPVEGVGHFEPLRHYAEVHLLLEPGEPGSGLVFASACSEDMLEGNWQRLILTHLAEKKHKGVLTGSEVTDLKITLIAGRAHQKHTEGGDFRQATYRALRQGLKMGCSRLLEPVYEFRLEIPKEQVGRAMADLLRMHGTFSGPEALPDAGMSFAAKTADGVTAESFAADGAGDARTAQSLSAGQMALLTGTAPVASMQGYQTQLMAYTKGKGRLFLSFKGYEPCHNEEEVIAAIGYDSERDLENPTGSVFCAHGAGFLVDYSQVYDYMHVEGRLAAKKERIASEEEKSVRRPTSSYDPDVQDEAELEAIFKRTYGDVGQQRRGWKKKTAYKEAYTREYKTVRSTKRPDDAGEYLLVDGYNVIFGWDELKELAKRDLGAARGKLMDLLSNYQGYKKNTVILVFDAYRVEGNPGSSQMYHNIHVVYTREAETADQYIEKTTHDIAGRHKVTVATSDGLEQVIILGQGAVRMSAKGLKAEIEAVNQEIRRELAESSGRGEKNYLLEGIEGKLAEDLEAVRLGKQKGSES